MNTEVIRVESMYRLNEVCVFCKVKDEFGDFSNMSNEFPVRVNGHKISNTEALYQACRFPDHIDKQKEVVFQGSGMSAKMKSKKFKSDSRSDWEEHRVDIMWWCLKIKLAQHGHKLGRVLESTGDKPIVELSHKDRFWGAVLDEKKGVLIGQNVLGQLLMRLRTEYQNKKDNIRELAYVEPPEIEKFLLLGLPILPVGRKI
jgi:ribA/ribD-fused uncharacterized protein